MLFPDPNQKIVDDYDQFVGSLQVLLGLVVALGLVVIASLYMDGENIERVPLLPTIVASALPIAVFMFIVSRSNSKNFGIGYGLAAGIAVPLVLVLPFLILVLLAVESSAVVAANRALMLLFFVALYVVVTASLKSGKMGARFAIGFVIAFIYAVTAAGVISQMEPPKVRSAKAREMVAAEALSSTKALTACLIGHEALHPDVGFPKSLSTVPSDWGCNDKVSAASTVPKYQLSYEQTVQNTVSTADFRLILVPKKRPGAAGDPLMTDSRGLMFAWYGWSDPRGVVPRLMLQQSDLENSNIWSLRTDFNHYLQRFGTPSSFDEVVAKFPNLAGWSRAGATGQQIRQGPYVVNYTISQTEPQQVEISAVCRSYGEQCIRSYLVDFDGRVHWTAQPRPATAADAVLSTTKIGSPCEGPPPCADAVEWPMPRG